MECGRHSNITLHTLTELMDVQGTRGDFTVRLKQHPRYIDMERCIACGACAEKCPKKVENLFNAGIDTRKAAYILYGQTVPLKYAIDGEHCIYLRKGKCRVCEKICPTGAVDFSQQEEEFSIAAGAVILAPGFTSFDPSGVDYLGDVRVPDVVTGLAYERMLSASGPLMGHLVRPSDGTVPKRIAWLQCVGSRSINRCDHPYCSGVCCMYAIKQARVTLEHIREGAELTVFFMDIRAHGKGFERYLHAAKEKGVRFVRARPHSILPGQDGGVRTSYVLEDGRELTEQFDMMVLSTGMEQGADTRALADRAGIDLDRFGFARTTDLDPTRTSRPGIFACGAFTAPRDIPVSVVEAGAAACAAISTLSGEGRERIAAEKRPPARDLANEPPRIGVFVCSCGINIAGVVNVDQVARFARELPYVTHVDQSLFTCSQDSMGRIAAAIRKHDLNRVVVAACSPRTHETIFRETLTDAGVNKYLFEMANIRNQGSWVHGSDPAAATRRAMDQVRMAVSKVGQLVPLSEPRLQVDPAALVVGGGLTGMQSALELAGQGFPVHLVERGPTLGGYAAHLLTTAKGEDIRVHVANLAALLQDHPLVTIYLNSTIKRVDGFVGNFSTTIQTPDEERIVTHGAAILATGAREHRPEEYGYGTHPRIMTHLDMDRAIADGTLDPKNTRSTVFIQCVGSREPHRPACSRLCCTHTVKAALRFKEANPDNDVYVLYRDLRTYGMRELLYQEARKRGVLFIRFHLEDKPRVVPAGDRLEVTVRDHILDRNMVIEADLVSLAAAVVPEDNRELARQFKLSVDRDGWFQEAHQKLRPVDFAIDGVFMAGLAHSPKPVEESLAQARAAVSRAGTVLGRTELTLPGTVAVVDTAKCTGCSVCWTICPYQAIDQDEKGLAAVNPSLCKGCGLCVAACRSGAPNLQGFSTGDVLAQLDVLGWETEDDEEYPDHA